MDFFDFLKDNKLILFITSIVMNMLFILAFSVLLYKYLNYTCICENSSVEFSNQTGECKQEKSFFVEIKGAVKNPGVYEATNNNIIDDIVKLAGGFTKKAYTKNINLSRKVSDELVIYVFTESEYKKENTKVITQIVQEKCECSSYDIGNCTDNKVSEIIPSDKDTAFDNDTNIDDMPIKLVNINTATKNELMNLSGIGESKAEDILEYRNRNGSFKTIEEIKNVSGIGDALFSKIKENITV